jgi:hypothetical protein
MVNTIYTFKANFKHSLEVNIKHSQGNPNTLKANFKHSLEVNIKQSQGNSNTLKANSNTHSKTIQTYTRRQAKQTYSQTQFNTHFYRGKVKQTKGK